MGHGVRTEGKPAGVRDRAAENWKRSEVKPGRDKVKGTWRGDTLAAPKVGLGGWSVWPGRDWHGLGRSTHSVPGEEGHAQPVRKQLLRLLCARHEQNRHGKAAKGGTAHSDTLRAEGRCPSLGSTLNPTGRIKSFRFCNSFVTSDRTYGGRQDAE